MTIEAVIKQYWDAGDNLNLHRHRSFEGYSKKNPQGAVRMELWVGQCSGEALGDAYTGWKSVSRIMIEEVSRPYLGPSPSPKGVSNTLWRCFTHSRSQSFNPFGPRRRSSGNENVFSLFSGEASMYKYRKCNMCKAHALEVFFDHLNYFSF